MYSSIATKIVATAAIAWIQIATVSALREGTGNFDLETTKQELLADGRVSSARVSLGGGCYRKGADAQSKGSGEGEQGGLHRDCLLLSLRVRTIAAWASCRHRLGGMTLEPALGRCLRSRSQPDSAARGVRIKRPEVAMKISIMNMIRIIIHFRVNTEFRFAMAPIQRQPVDCSTTGHRPLP